MTVASYHDKYLIAIKYGNVAGDTPVALLQYQRLVMICGDYLVKYCVKNSLVFTLTAAIFLFIITYF